MLLGDEISTGVEGEIDEQALGEKRPIADEHLSDIHHHIEFDAAVAAFMDVACPPCRHPMKAAARGRQFHASLAAFGCYWC